MKSREWVTRGNASGFWDVVCVERFGGDEIIESLVASFSSKGYADICCDSLNKYGKTSEDTDHE